MMNSDYIRSKMRDNANRAGVPKSNLGQIDYKQAKSMVRDTVSGLIDLKAKQNSYKPKDYSLFVFDAIDKFVSEAPLVEGFISEAGQSETERLKKALIADFTQHGKLQSALDAEDISEIQINDYNSIWVERNGNREPYIDSTTGKRITFTDKEEYNHFVNALLLEDNKKITSTDALIDAITGDGYRTAVQGESATVADKEGNYKYKPTCMTIRKQRSVNFTTRELVESGGMSNNMGRLLEMIPLAKLTSFIGGPTGSGKTVILQNLADNCPDDMRIAALGNPAELKLRRRYTSGEDKGVIRNNVVHLEAKEWYGSDKPPKEFPTIENCARANLRLTPDVIIYEEIRSKEEFEFTADAAQTGHFFLTSLHAKDVKGLLSRYVTMYISATQGIDRDTAVDILAEFLSIVIIRKKLSDNTRRITEICEINGAKYDEAGHRTFNINPIYSFIRDKDTIEKSSTGAISRKSLKRAVKGRHYRVGSISDRLCQDLFDAGFDEATIDFLRRPLKRDDSGKVIPEPESYEYSPLFID